MPFTSFSNGTGRELRRVEHPRPWCLRAHFEQDSSRRFGTAAFCPARPLRAAQGLLGLLDSLRELESDEEHFPERRDTPLELARHSGSRNAGAHIGRLKRTEGASLRSPNSLATPDICKQQRTRRYYDQQEL